PELADIRGPGFMVAAEFIGPAGPDAGLTARVLEQALARGLLLLTCGVHGNVIRFLAPLTIPNDQFAQALDILEEAMLAARA
ncbi:MAG: aminotransferase class III-fold pyridoxal phosphate-dependent enzyme, partial [Paracoccus marcusii]